jgi:hypothetical protein
MTSAFVQFFTKYLQACGGRSATFAIVESLSVWSSLGGLKLSKGKLSLLTRMEEAEARRTYADFPDGWRAVVAAEKAARIRCFRHREGPRKGHRDRVARDHEKRGKLIASTTWIAAWLEKPEMILAHDKSDKFTKRLLLPGA